MEEKLDLTRLSKAIASFRRALDEYEKDQTNEFVRDASIQRFEYCYDLSTKLLKRHLRLISEDPGKISQMPFQEVIRDAYTKRLLRNSWDQWWQYRDDRNATSHAYDENRALAVVNRCTGFYKEALFLLERLQDVYEAQV